LEINIAHEGIFMENENSDLKNKVEDLRKELYQVEGLRDSLNLEAQKWAEKRNRIHKSLKESISEITNIKAKLKVLNERASALRASLQKSKERYREKKVQFQNLHKKLKDFMTKGLYMDGQELEDKIGKIDWKIQTTPLPIEEEKTLIEQVKLFESQLLIHKQIEKLKDEMESLKDEMSAAYQEISELAEQRGRLREGMLNFSERVSELKAEADEMHKKYLEYKDESQKVHLKYMEVLSRIKTLEQEVTKIEEERRSKRALELESDLERRALEKLKNRKKLTFDEFKILAEKGRI